MGGSSLSLECILLSRGETRQMDLGTVRCADGSITRTVQELKSKIEVYWNLRERSLVGLELR
jgi:hypothetical protein